jgi:hypothetical protein
MTNEGLRQNSDQLLSFESDYLTIYLLESDFPAEEADGLGS